MEGDGVDFIWCLLSDSAYFGTSVFIILWVILALYNIS